MATSAQGFKRERAVFARASTICRPSALRGSGVGAVKSIQHGLDLSDRHRFAGRRMEGDFSGLQQVFSMKARGKPFEAHRCNVPIAITPRTLQQIKLFGRTIEKGAAKFTQQNGVIAGRSRKSRIKGSVIERHPP